MSTPSTAAWKLRRILFSLVLLGSAPLISGCAETIIGAGATTAVAASQERGLGGAVGDTQIRQAIQLLRFANNAAMYHHVNLNVPKGRDVRTDMVQRRGSKVDKTKRERTQVG